MGFARNRVSLNLTKQAEAVFNQDDQQHTTTNATEPSHRPKSATGRNGGAAGGDADPAPTCATRCRECEPVKASSEIGLTNHRQSRIALIIPDTRNRGVNVNPKQALT